MINGASALLYSVPARTTVFRAAAAAAATASSRPKQRFSSTAARRTVRYATTMSELEVCVKAKPGTETLGDFLLTLEEKKVPYSLKFVDLSNKPEWFLAINPEGKVPCTKFDGEWIADSDEICRILEEKFPEKLLETPESASGVGGKVFPAFVQYLKTGLDEKKEELVAQLTALDEYLATNGPFLGKEVPCAADMSLIPKLYHMKVALKHYRLKQDFDLPDELSNVKNYMASAFSLDSFKKTEYPEESIIEGWAIHLSS